MSYLLNADICHPRVYVGQLLHSLSIFWYHSKQHKYIGSYFTLPNTDPTFSHTKCMGLYGNQVEKIKKLLMSYLLNADICHPRIYVGQLLHSLSILWYYSKPHKNIGLYFTLPNTDPTFSHTKCMGLYGNRSWKN